MGTRKPRPLGQTTVLILDQIRRGARYGFEIIERTGLASGTVYPTLTRMEKRGYVSARWEDREAAVSEGRPPRRYYSLTAAGVAALEEALAVFRRVSTQLGESEA